MSDGDLQRDLNRLAERLARIERRLGIESESSELPNTGDVTAPIASHESQPSAKGQAFGRLFQTDSTVESSQTPAPLPAPPIAPPTSPSISRRREPAIIPFNPAPPPIVQPPPVVYAANPPAAAAPMMDVSSDQESVVDFDVLSESEAADANAAPAAPPPHRPATPSLEVLIGGKWMAWVGALVVILAAGFAVKVGIDQGLWRRLPPIWRCLGIAAFGAALLIAGEIALRRIGKAAAAGLISAGLGTLYLDAFATFRGYKPPLVAQEWAFVLMGLVAIGGFALTVRTRFLSIGVLSILGGYLTPVLLRGDSTHDIELLLYLSMLLGVSLALSGFMRRPFGALRYVALGCHLLIALAWVLTNLAQWQMAMFFMSAWWSMVVVESVFTAMRGRAAIGNVVMTLIATAAYVTGGCLVLRSGSSASAEWIGAFAAMVAVVGGFAVLQFGSGVDALRERVRQPIDLLSVALWLQCGVLVATAIALQFDGFGQVIGWLAMGLAAIEIGRRLPSRGVTSFGIVVGALATLRVCLLPVTARIGPSQVMLQPLFDVIGFDVSRWAILAIITIIALHVAISRLPRTDSWRHMRIIMVVVATVIWLGACMHQSDGLIVTAGWLAYAVVLLSVRRSEFARGAEYLNVGLAVLAATAGRWLVIDALGQRLNRAWQADECTAFINWQMGLAVAIAGVGWWACRALAERERERASNVAALPVSRGQSLFWQGVLIAGMVFGLVAVSFEIDRSVVQSAMNRAAGTFAITHVRQLLFTLAWAMGSVVLAVIARTLMAGDDSNGIARTWLLRRFAWSLITICAMKWIVFDAIVLVATNRGLFDAAAPLLNLQMLVGVALAGAMLSLGVIIAAPSDGASIAVRTGHPLLALPFQLRAWMPVLACLMLLWGLTFEVDRLLTQAAPLPSWLAAFQPMHVRSLLWTLLWLLGAAAMFGIGRRKRLAAIFGSGISLAALAGIAWLTFDTIAWRISDAPVAVMPIANLQCVVGVICAIVLAVMAAIVRGLSDEVDDSASNSNASVDPKMLANLLFALVGAIGLWLGSIEIDRIFSGSGDAMVKQAGLSIWWAVYAVGLVVLGFARHLAMVRYAGLALLSLAVIKVLLIDMSNLNSLPRVLSFAGAGLLLILTSIVYAKLSPVLLGDADDATARRV